MSAGIIRHALDGRLVVSPNGKARDNPHYFRVDLEQAIRPDPTHAAWLYAQMVRWRQAALSAASARTAVDVFRPDLFDAALASFGGSRTKDDTLGAFAGPPFDPKDIAGHLAAWGIGARG